MKVLFMIDTLEYGGSEKSLLDLTTHFKKTEAFVYQIYEGDTLKAEFERNGIRVVCGHLTGKRQYVRGVRNAFHQVHLEKPDLIHTTLARSNVIGRITGRMSQIPVISSFVNDSYSPARLSRASPSLQRKLKFTKWIDRLTSRYVSHFVANSQATKDSNCLELDVSPKRVTVIYRGRNPDLFSSSHHQTNEFRSSFGIGRDVPIILNVGRLHPQKGQKDLLRAMELIQRQTGAHLLLAGEGPLRSDLQKLVRELNLEEKVSFLGTRKDIPELLHLADVFAFPSYYEGHPGAVVEAMFAARPIVVSDIPVHREAIVHGETGFLVPPGSPELLAERLIDMLKNQSQGACMGQRAREKALKTFDINIIASLHEDLYEKVLNHWRGNKEKYPGSM